MTRSSFSTKQIRLAAAGLALALGGSLGLVALASAQEDVPPPPAGGPSMPPAPGMPPAPAVGEALSPMEGLWRGHFPPELQLTEAQKDKLHQIAEATRRDLQKQREARRAEVGEWEKLLAAPKVDAKAAEALRAKMEAAHDATSRRLLQSTLESAAVLTPEQRVRLVAQWKARCEPERPIGRPGAAGPRDGRRGLPHAPLASAPASGPQAGQ